MNEWGQVFKNWVLMALLKISNEESYVFVLLPNLKTK